MVGASPLISSWFHDEPTVAAANAIGFDVGTLGNHEFDEGGDELLRLLQGGRRTGPEALKRDADGRLVNTSDPASPALPFPRSPPTPSTAAAGSYCRPTASWSGRGVRIRFIGATTACTPIWLLGRHAARFRFGDVSQEVNRWVPVLRAQGVEAIVVLAHEGAPRQDAINPEGPIVTEARQMDPAVDVVIAGHSHSLLNMRVDGKLVVEALSYGVAYDLVDLTVDRASGDVVSASARIPFTDHVGGAPDPGLSELVAARRARVAPLAERRLGDLPAPLTRAGGDLARLAAEAQREQADADLAMVSPASLRADLDAGPLTYEELFAAQAYDHPAASTGADRRGADGDLGLQPRGGRALKALRAREGRPRLRGRGERAARRPAGRSPGARPRRSPGGSEVEALTGYLRRHPP